MSQKWECEISHRFYWSFYVSFCLPQQYRGLHTHCHIQYLVKNCLQILLHSEKCFTYYHFTWMVVPHYRMMYVQSLKLEGCFYIHLWNGEIFSVLTLNLSLRHVSMSMIHDHMHDHNYFGRQSWSNMQLIQVWHKCKYCTLRRDFSVK